MINNYITKSLLFLLSLISLLTVTTTPNFNINKVHANTYEPYLIKDITSGAGSTTFFEIGDVTPIFHEGIYYFVADDGTHGVELWRSNGTEAGTHMVKDINPGSGSSYVESFIVFNDIIYFTGKTDTYGGELWRTDGTSSGTFMVKDITVGEEEGYPYDYVIFNNKLLFGAYTEETGNELWQSDGTESGTSMIKDINLGSAGSTPQFMTVLNDVVVFTATTEDEGSEVWVTDGTVDGTTLLKDIHASDSSNVESYYPLGDLLLFVAYSEDEGYELWKTDGTTIGTELVKDIYTGTNNSGVHNLFLFNNEYYFNASDGVDGEELWKTDGTESGTVLVKDINESGDSSPIYFKALGDELFFIVNLPSSEYEIWKTDGTEGGTVLVKKLSAGDLGTWFNSEIGFVEYANKLYFVASANEYQEVTLDTTARYLRVSSVERFNTYPISLKELEIYLEGDLNTNVAADGTATASTEDAGDVAANVIDEDFSTQWTSEASGDVTSPYLDDANIYIDLGSEESIALVKLVWGEGFANSYTIDVSDDGSEWTTVHTNSNSHGSITYTEVWQTDGTQEGTYNTTNLNFDADDEISEIYAYGEYLVFVSSNDDNSNNIEIFTYDGTTLTFHDVNEGLGGSNPTVINYYDGLLYFFADNGISGVELFGLRIHEATEEDEEDEESEIDLDFKTKDNTKIKKDTKYPYGTKVTIKNSDNYRIKYQWVKSWDKQHNPLKWKTYKKSIRAPEGKYTLYVKINGEIKKQKIHVNNKKEVYSVSADINHSARSVTLNWKMKEWDDDVSEVKVYRTLPGVLDLSNLIGTNAPDDTFFLMNSTTAWNNFDYIVIAYDKDGKKINSKIIPVRIY